MNTVGGTYEEGDENIVEC